MRNLGVSNIAHLSGFILEMGQATRDSFSVLNGWLHVFRPVLAQGFSCRSVYEVHPGASWASNGIVVGLFVARGSGSIIQPMLDIQAGIRATE